MTDWVAASGADETARIAAGAALIAAAIGGITSILAQWFAGRRDEARTRGRRQEDRLSAQLNELYGPLVLLLRQNKYLYDKLRSGKGGGPWHLLHNIPTVLANPTDKALAEEILRIDEEMEKFIIAKAGLLVIGGKLPGSFARFLGHSRALRIAWDAEGHVPTASEFETFPPDFAQHVEQGYARIQTELKARGIGR